MLGLGLLLLLVFFVGVTAEAGRGGGAGPDDNALLAAGGFLCLGEAFFGWATPPPERPLNRAPAGPESPPT